ncbi:histidine kinase [Hyphomicrobium nitrativorans NL23]|uniref:Histidine kinase n=1 Tax=Hyphomicrobium nitrativorans NL23 TaxID=1029756 RepID=V5SD07_9HYPH|nr:sensor histidine kinase [Hyphomicrobium nitrativorans]AHB48362.1 histidine kinase [Hyphomicrobium nitrativorans NL23]
MDLKWLLVRRIALVALVCFLAGSALALYETSREAKRLNVELATLVSRQLDLQLSRIDRSTDIPARFPDWDVVATYTLLPGQCVEFHGTDARRQRVSCAGTDSNAPPHWFFAAHRTFINRTLTATIPIAYRDEDRGSVVASYHPAATASAAWSTISPLLGFSAALVAALCVMVYFVVDRALRPAKDILDGLNRMARGDLSYRLPKLRLTELNRISEVFNALSEDLRKSTSERAELAHRLVDAQEQERRHIARELHDEIAQKLAALNALAASIRTSAQRERLPLAEEARSLEAMASNLMISLRRTLTHLRPQEIDDFGLVQSLRALIEEHNKKAHGNTRYVIETAGDVGTLRMETSAHVYRIIQEALNNASQHANAKTVTVHLSEADDAGLKKIKLSVIDDGTGPQPKGERSELPRSGIIGMRERVTALSGQFTSGALPNGGFGLHVEFPIMPRGA